MRISLSESIEQGMLIGQSDSFSNFLFTNTWRAVRKLIVSSALLNVGVTSYKRASEKSVVINGFVKAEPRANG